LTGKAQLINQIGTELGFKFDAAAIRDIAAEIEWRNVLALAKHSNLATVGNKDLRNLGVSHADKPIRLLGV
jgi:hypothetical protein